jgi:DNA replication protein DnaC
MTQEFEMPPVEEPFRGYNRMCSLVGPRYARCWFDNYKVGNDEAAEYRESALEDAVEYARRLKVNKGSGENLLLIGSCGTGKDHLAVAVSRAALSFGMNVKYMRGSVLCRHCVEHNKEHGTDVPYETLNVDLLVISDIEPNANKASDFEERALMTLIDYRYTQMLPTVVTSNSRTLDDLAEIIGERIVSRLNHFCALVPMIWDDYRSQQ